MDSIKHHILKQSSKYLIFGLTSVDFHHPYTRLDFYLSTKSVRNTSRTLPSGRALQPECDNVQTTQKYKNKQLLTKVVDIFPSNLC